MSGYTARLLNWDNSRSLTISSGRYQIMLDFIPPSAAEATQVSDGLSSNRYGGGDLVGTRGVNQEWSFTVKVVGSSIAETERGLADLRVFLREARYLEWVANGDMTAAPFYGQGDWRRVEIVHGTVDKNELYLVGNVRAETQFGLVTLTIRPYVLGRKQRLAFAAGGVFDDTIGEAMGYSKGLRVPLGTTNKMTNPVLGHATFGNGWTAGSAVAATANYDRRFILWGHRSVRLITQNGSSNNTYTQSINVGNTNAHVVSVYVKKPDGSAVTSSDCRVYYGGGVASTYQSLGDGWYRVYAGVTGVSGNTTTGIELRAVGAGVYLAGAQIEEKAYPTPLAYGDMLGCAFTGTPHESTSTRTAATLSIPTGSVLNQISGTIRVALEMDCDQTCATFTVFQVYESAAGLECYFNATDDKFYLTDGTNTISSAAQTFAIGDKVVLHASWKSGALALYKNGASIASGSTYTPATAAGSVYILCDQAGAEQMRGRLLDFTSWSQALTAAEILADYTNQATLLADGQQLSALPWVHTYATISPSDTLTVAGGISGNVDADTYLTIDATMSTAYDLYVNQWTGERFSKLQQSGVNFLYRHIDAVTSVTTSGELVDSTYPLVMKLDIENYAGKKVWIVGSLIDAGSNLYGAAALVGIGATVVGKYRAVTAHASNYYVFLFGPIRIPSVRDFLYPDDLYVEKIVNLYMRLIRSTGSANNVTVHWMQALPERLCKFDMVSGVVPTAYKLLINGRDALRVNDSNDQAFETVTPVGDLIELVPNQVNHLTLWGMNDGGVQAGIAWSISEAAIVPRWLIG